MNKFHFTAFAFSAIFSTTVHADDYQTSWQLQGPAFSYHFSNVGAPVHDVTKNDGANAPLHALPGTSLSEGDSTVDYCKKYGANTEGGQVFSNSTPQSVIDAAIKSGQEATIKARADCMNELLHPYKDGVASRWNQTNLELGLQYTQRDLQTKTVRKYFTGAVVDSYFKPGVYSGASYQWNLSEGERLRVDAGATGMLWYRMVAGRDAHLHRRLVPVVLPVLSIEDKRLGVGVNFSFIPKIRVNNLQYAVDTLVMQITWAL